MSSFLRLGAEILLKLSAGQELCNNEKRLSFDQIFVFILIEDIMEYIIHTAGYVPFTIDIFSYYVSVGRSSVSDNYT